MARKKAPKKESFVKGLFFKFVQVGIVFLATPYIQKQLAPYQGAVNKLTGVSS